MSNENYTKKRKSPTRKPAIQRIADKTIPIPECGCHIFTGATGDYGHGIIWDDDQRLNKAHRIVYRELVGPIPEGHFVCHKCDVPSCVNPDHLFVGTAMDNHKDMMSKGRESKPPRNLHDIGEYRYNSKLTESMVLQMRERYANGESGYKLHKEYGISMAVCYRILKRKSWKHI